MRRGALTLAAAFVLAQPTAAWAVDPQVAALQVALSSKRLYAGSVDGIEGAATRSATRSLQRMAGIAPTGHAGPATRRALGRLGRPAFGARPIRRGMAGLDVSTLQFLLAARGFDVGVLDGDFGPRTRDALLGFQRLAHLTPDGIAGPATRGALCSAPGCVPRGRRPRFQAAWPAVSVAPGAVRTDVEHAAGRADVDAGLALAVAWVESGYQANIRSSTGDWGPMQVSAPAWDYVEGVLLGHAVPHTTRGNIRVGVVYLRHLLHEFGNDERLGVGAYHQGAASVRRRGLLPETESYVSAVQAIAARS